MPADKEAPAYTKNDRLKFNIAATEALTLRAIREFILGDPSAKGRLQAIDAQINALRNQLDPE